MHCLNKKAVSFLSLSLILLSIGSLSWANNLSISDVTLGDRNPSKNTVKVKFSVSWENSWKTKINHDAVWITVRLQEAETIAAEKKLCSIEASGVNPTGSSVGSNPNFEIYVPADKRGAFIRPSEFGKYPAASSTGVELEINYESCGFEAEGEIYASVLGIEMVYVPEGSFYAGDYDTSSAALHQGSADKDPWYVSSESIISVTNAASNSYQYVSNGNAGEDPTGTAFNILPAFPKGFKAFYAMKYEITEGLWVEFVNSLSAAARSNHDLTDGSHKSSDLVVSRNTISCSGSPLTCATERPSRAVNYLTWMDLAAILDWAALRPMSELEFEKMARGPLLATGGEFAWGTTDITAASTLSGIEEDGTETVTNPLANAQFNQITLSGGDAALGVEYTQGPLRSGIFAIENSTRVTSGSGYYGIMELSGNVRERAVTVGNSTGRLFAGNNGDGVLTDVLGFEGNANELNWPGMDPIAARGVTGASGSGFKGGGFNDQLSGARLRISDRSDAANTSSASFSDAGGRGVRTYDGT